jgi:dTDP-glucose 4,6-dehydratase
MLECAKVVLEVTASASKLVFEPLPQDDPKQRCPDISKAKALLGWNPTIDLRTGLLKSLDYFRESLAVANRGSNQGR